jgi:DNA-binding SARP family transcriptional activator
MELRLLGPVEVRRHGQEVSIPPRMLRTLLAALAADAGRLVQAETLIERLWGARPPDRPRHALHVYVARLRAALSQGAIVRRSSGYALQIARRSVDVHLFRELVAAGELETALDLPRGTPLEDLTGAWAEQTRLTWERWHLNAAITWAERETATGGDPHHIVARLGDLCDRHPYAEPLSASLILALDTAGRRAEALHRYAHTRHRLRDDLGTEPGTHLRTIHQRLLQTH